jgi:hypothetical protein
MQQVTHQLMLETSNKYQDLRSHPGAVERANRPLVDRVMEHMKKCVAAYRAAEQEAAVKQKQFVAQAQRQSAAARQAAAAAEQYDDEERQKQEERQWLLAQERQRQAALEEELQFNDTMIAERIESIREIESAILDINALYKELGMQVELQGQMIGAHSRYRRLLSLSVM